MKSKLFAGHTAVVYLAGYEGSGSIQSFDARMHATG
jgi:hypothetical protein